MQRLISTSGDVGRPRACMRGVSGTLHVGLWLRCILRARNDLLRGASSPHSTAGVYTEVEQCLPVGTLPLCCWLVKVYNAFVANPKPSPCPRIFSRIRLKPSACQILRTVTTLAGTNGFPLTSYNYARLFLLYGTEPQRWHRKIVF